MLCLPSLLPGTPGAFPDFHQIVNACQGKGKVYGNVRLAQHLPGKLGRAQRQYAYKGIGPQLQGKEVKNATIL